MAVNKFDNSMLDAGTTGTTANKLLQLDGSAKIPAVDGSLLTGIPSSFTKSSSDPVIATNPSGGVGTIWVNTTSGEVYCCTDATAGENVWTNIGAGTGNVEPWNFPGETYGYCQGSGSPPAKQNVIDKWSFTSQLNAVDVGNLTGGNTYGPTTWSDFDRGYGWTGCVGFVTGWTYKDNIEKFSYSSDGNSIDVCNMFLAGGNRSSCNSADYGYAMGGNAPAYSNQMQKFSMVSGANGTDVGNLVVGVQNLGSPDASSTTYGYTTGGQAPAKVDHIQKRVFASDGDASDIANLTEAKYWGAKAHV